MLLPSDFWVGGRGAKVRRGCRGFPGGTCSLSSSPTRWGGGLCLCGRCCVRRPNSCLTVPLPFGSSFRFFLRCRCSGRSGSGFRCTPTSLGCGCTWIVRFGSGANRSRCFRLGFFRISRCCSTCRGRPFRRCLSRRRCRPCCRIFCRFGLTRGG